MEDEDEIVPASDNSDSNDDYTDINGEGFEDEDEEGEQSSSLFPSSDEDLKSKNVDALLRYVFMFSPACKMSRASFFSPPSTSDC